MVPIHCNYYKIFTIIVDTIEEKCREAFKKNDSLQKEFDKIAHLEEIIEQRNRDIQQLTQQLDIVREEGARHVSFLSFMPIHIYVYKICVFCST